MPIVSGTTIGLDNTCKAVYGLQEFFDKGNNATKKSSLKGELMAYQDALKHDINLVEAHSALGQSKQERLTQIEAYLTVLSHLEQHKELDCLSAGYPTYPRPLEGLMQDRAASNLYSMVLRPEEEDGYLRTEAANPIFSVAHRSIAETLAQLALHYSVHSLGLIRHAP